MNKRSNEAYILIDHRNSPGVSPEFIAQNKLDAPAVGAGKVFESAMVMCHSCGGSVILNPNRSRGREWCMQHDAYLCDRCALMRKITGICTPLKQKLDGIFTKLLRST